MGRHEGTRWSLLFGSYEGVEKFAVEEAQRHFQSYLPYVMRVDNAAKSKSPPDFNLSGHLLLVGTPTDNPLIAQLIEKKAIPSPVGAEGYTLACVASPWSAESKVVAVAGTDSSGVLYGVERLGLTLLPDLAAPLSPQFLRKSIDDLPFFSLSESPKIRNRGIWTWGYVIYDYRRFIDRMAKLRMNMLTIWNDVPPINSRDVIDYAHSRGVKVIMGFEWGWGIEGLDICKAEDRRKIRGDVVEKYERDYAGLGMDGIYFQTITEHSNKEKVGVSVASAARDLVNDTAGELLRRHPSLVIQFGLHATSIGDRQSELSGLDPRVTIVWEDAGDIPFRYNLSSKIDKCYAMKKPEEWVDSPEATVEYSRRLAALRGEKSEFAIVPKGWICLDWQTEFEHHESFILGERDARTARARLEAKRRYWEQVNALWLKHNKDAIRYYREMLKCHKGPITVCGLIEDGLLEAEVQPSVALFAETIWDPTRGEEDTLQASHLLAQAANMS